MGHEKTEDHLPIFKSPVVQDHDDVHEVVSLDDLSRPQTQRSYASEQPWLKSASAGVTVINRNTGSEYHGPAFRRHAEATNAELFYDLFFVANLTVFTLVRKVNDIDTLKQYIGFFGVLWLTWYQVSLYDVRFSMDCVADRLAKAFQFGVMIGFAVVGPNFNVGAKTADADPYNAPKWTSFRALSLILMTSRLVLVFQYLQAVYYTRKWTQAMVPLIAITCIYSIASFVYLGLFFTFSAAGNNQAYIAWYILAMLETIAATALSSIFRVISFKGTHLVERMSLLTLIFLGEGVIAAAKRTQLVLISDAFGVTPATVGAVAANVLIVYFVYMLYFDWIEEKHFGTIRQQIWAFMHFPLHLALVVAVEGAAQVSAWTAANDASIRLLNMDFAFPAWDASNATMAKAVKSLNATAKIITQESFAKLTYSKYGKWLTTTKIVEGSMSVLVNSTALEEDKVDALANVFGGLKELAYDLAGFAAPKYGSYSVDVGDADAEFEALSQSVYKQYGVFGLTFRYFFVAIGLVVALIGLIAMLSKTGKQAIDWTRLSITIALGLGLCLLSLMANYAQDDDHPLYDEFISSPFILPVTAIVLFVTVLLNNVKFMPTALRLPRGRRNRPVIYRTNV